MNRVLVDSTVWSLMFRRDPSRLSVEQLERRKECVHLVRLRQALMVGPVRQELLSGLRDASQFERVRSLAAPIAGLPLTSREFEQAAEASNRLKRQGISVSPVDALLCALSLGFGHPIFTDDRDFAYVLDVLPIRLHSA